MSSANSTSNASKAPKSMVELDRRMQALFDNLTDLAFSNVSGQPKFDKASELLKVRANDLESYIENPESDAGLPAHGPEIESYCQALSIYHNHWKTHVASAEGGSMPAPVGALKRLTDKAKQTQTTESGQNQDHS